MVSFLLNFKYDIFRIKVATRAKGCRYEVLRMIGYFYWIDDLSGFVIYSQRLYSTIYLNKNIIYA